MQTIFNGFLLALTFSQHVIYTTSCSNDSVKFSQYCSLPNNSHCCHSYVLLPYDRIGQQSETYAASQKPSVAN